MENVPHAFNDKPAPESDPKLDSPPMESFTRSFSPVSTDALPMAVSGSFRRDNHAAVAELPLTLSPGSYLEHYEVVRPLGAGGMGSVFLARDTKLGRLVAIKILHEAGGAASRLLAEARATAQAIHENIVVIHQVGVVDRRPFMVLEYVEGRTLREIISTAERENGRSLPRGLVVEIVVSVLRALEAAHQKGIIHRDLKPENIILADTGQVKVLDFGLAMAADSHSKAVRGGTRAYMSPEQWTGQTLDARSDIWAVGILFYELLGGRHPLAPLDANRLAMVTKLEMPMPRLREIRPELTGLSDIIERCLSKHRDERFASAGEVIAALEPFRARSRFGPAGNSEHPFAGLAAFQEADESRFHGRDRDILALLGCLERQPLVVLTGASGAGKSSLIRAGLIPALKRSGESWDIRMVRPGRTPLATLRSILDPADQDVDLQAQPMDFGARLRAYCKRPTAPQRILVFVDQYEELYTLVPDSAERQAYVACLLGAADEASSPLRIIWSLRADFLDRVAEDPRFMARMAGGLFFLPPMTRDAQREALILPVEACGYQFENHTTVEAMLDELADTKNPLPLLQFAATQWWEARDTTRKLLSDQAYRDMGGVGGVLAGHADRVVASLSADDQLVCRAIFLRLITPERTRAVVYLRELGTLDVHVETIVQQLATARLLLVDKDVEHGSAKVEIVHESLIERWPTLRRWLDENAGDAHFLARLRAAATQWEASGKSPGLLWRDREADEARVFYERHRRASTEARRARLGTAEARYIEAVSDFFEQSRKRKIRLIAAAFVGVCLVATIVSWLAIDARRQARRADEEAARVRDQNAELALQALRGRNATRMLAARNSQEDPTLVLALLREIEAPDVPKDWPQLVSAALSAGVARDVWRTDPARCAYSIVMSPDGKRLAVAMDDNTVRILRPDLSEEACLRGHDKLVWSVAWSPDGRRVVSASNDLTARVWFVDGSRSPLVLRGHGDLLNSARFSPDGERIVTAADDDTARVWDARDGREIVALPHDADVQSAVWSPDGKRVLTTTANGMGRVWQADGQGKPLELRGHEGVVSSGDFHPDGSRIVTAGRDHTVRMWDARAGNEIAVLRGHEGSIFNVAFSPDGERIATASKDKTARVWNASGTGSPLVLRGHHHWVYAATWSPDGKQILTTSLDGTQRRFLLDDIVAPTLLEGHEDAIRGLAISPDGKRIATTSIDTTLRVWNADGRGSAMVFRGHTGPVTYPRWSPDGSRIATASADKTARIWPMDASAKPIVLAGAETSIEVVAWRPDGKQLLTVSKDGTMTLWNDRGLEVAKTQKKTSTEFKVLYAAFDSTGKRILLTDTLDRTLYSWRPDDHAELETLGELDTPVRLARWSPDGTRVLAIATAGSARIFDSTNARVFVDVQAPKPIRNGIWSNDGRRIVFALEDGTFLPYQDGVWGAPIATGVPEEGHGSFALSPDGRRLLTTTPYGKVRVRYAEGEGFPFVFDGISLAIAHAVYSPRGDRIALTYEDKFAWVWPGVKPFTNTNDMRLWKTTSYCIPAELRVELLGGAPADAALAVEACRRHHGEVRESPSDP